MTVPLMRLNKDDLIILDGETYEEIDRTRTTLTIRTLDRSRARTLTSEEMRDLYFSSGKRLTIQRNVPARLDQRLKDAIARPFEGFSGEQQQEMLRRLDYVRACDRFFARKLYKKRPENGYVSIACVVARWRRYIRAHNDNLKTCQVPLELVSGYTLRDWYMRWIKSGRMFGALAPLTDKQGNRKQRLDPAVTAIIQRVVRQNWLTLERPPLTVAHDRICRDVRHLNEQGAGPHLEEPSEMAVRRWIQRNIEPFEVMYFRKGKKEAEHQFRVTARAPAAIRPLQIVEFDETPLNVMLVDSNGHPRGRANLTAGTCLATGMIVGWHIGWEKPSWTSVMQALRMAVLKKDTSGSGAESPYPVYGVGEVVKVDNGPPYRSTSLVAASGQLGFELRFVPAGKPHLKGKIERFFLEVSRDFTSVLPGRTFANTLERGDYDSEGFAHLTLQETQKLFMKWVVDVYHNRPNSRAFGQTPLERWDALSGHGVRLPPDAADLGALIGLVIKRTIVAEGIAFQGLTYGNASLKLLKKKFHLGHEWMVKIDPLDLLQVLVLNPESEKWEAFPCKQPELVEGLTLKMWMDVVASAKARTKAGQHVSRAILLRAREDLIREAEAMGHGPRGKLTTQEYEWVESRLDLPEYDISIDPSDEATEKAGPKPKRQTKRPNARIEASSFTQPASVAGGRPLANVKTPNTHELFEQAKQQLLHEANEHRLEELSTEVTGAHSFGSGADASGSAADGNVGLIDESDPNLWQNH